MQKIRITHLFLVLSGLLFFFLSSCEYEQIHPEKSDNPNDTIPDTVLVSYSGEIQPIWNKSCIRCHAPNLKPPDLTAANSYNVLLTDGYVDTLNPTSSIIYTEMTAGGGMAVYTNQSKADLVLKWIKEGAKNN